MQSDETKSASNNESQVADETDKYLNNCATDLMSLKAYPAVEMAYIKSNSSLPSSAVVERLFSAAGQF